LLKTNNINAYFTSLTHESTLEEKDLTVNAVSSLADIWITLKNKKQDKQRGRSLRIVKSRGMGHESGTQYFSISSNGIKLEKNKKLLTHLES